MDVAIRILLAGGPVTLVAVMTLALGIAASTATFSFINGTRLKPWTRKSTRPPRLGNSRTVFHSYHRHPHLRWKGDISIELKPGTFLFRFDKARVQP
jgi:hypothetical protein